MLSRPRGAGLGAPEAPCSQVRVPVSLRGKRGRDGLGDPDLLRYGALKEGPERVALGSRAETGPRFLSSLLPSESSLQSLEMLASLWAPRPPGQSPRGRAQASAWGTNIQVTPGYNRV